jgi:hypothetical protein
MQRCARGASLNNLRRLLSVADVNFSAASLPHYMGVSVEPRANISKARVFFLRRTKNVQVYK